MCEKHHSVDTEYLKNHCNILCIQLVNATAAYLAKNSAEIFYNNLKWMSNGSFTFGEMDSDSGLIPLVSS